MQNSVAAYLYAMPAVRPAYARARAAGWVPVRDALRADAAALADGADAVAGPAVRRAVYAVGEAFGWDCKAVCERWAAAGQSVDGPLSADQFRLEGHLIRQLGLTLDLFDRLRTGRAGGEGPEPWNCSAGLPAVRSGHRLRRAGPG